MTPETMQQPPAPLSSRAFGILWVRSEARQLLSRHWRRPSAAPALVLGTTWIACLVILAPVATQGRTEAAAVTSLLAVLAAGFVALWYAAVLLGAAWTWRTADRRWWLHQQQQPARAGQQAPIAAAAARSRDDRRLELVNVVAYPAGRGLGDQLLTQISADLDAEGATCTLRAVNTAAARLYSRHGFTNEPREALDWVLGRRMTRPPRKGHQ